MKAGTLDGVLNVIKPAGMTSFDVVAYLRRLLNIKKIGHCGTLDPSAAGVLPVCAGAATGITDYLSGQDKSYRAEILFGLATDSIDLDGNILRAERLPRPDKQKLEPVLAGLTGRQLQVPPMYSAVKSGGKRLYELARQGLEVSREPREITVYGIRFVRAEYGRVILDIDCSKGTYIRSICGDIGKRLGVDTCLSFLVRTSAAGLRIQDARTLEELEQINESGRIQEVLIPVEEMLNGYESCYLSSDLLRKFLNGVSIKAREIGLGSQPAEYFVKVFDSGGIFYAIGKVVFEKNDSVLRMKKLFRI